MTRRESDLKDYMKEQVRAFNGKATKQDGQAGEPDWLIAVPAPNGGARMGLLELKNRDEEPKDLQCKRLREWRSVGVPAAWADTEAQVARFLVRLRGGDPGLLAACLPGDVLGLRA